MTPEVEKLLEEFVRGAPERSSLQATALQRILNQLEVHETKDDARHTELKNSIAGINARVDKLERGVEDTGSHNVADLKRQLAERKAKDWDVLKLAAAGLGTVLLAMGTWLLGRFGR